MLKLQPFIFAVLLFLPSTVLLPNPLFFIFGISAFLIFRKRFFDNKNYQIVFLCLALSLIISLTAFFFSEGKLHFYGNFLPLHLGLIASLFCALVLDKKVAYYLIIFIFFEVLIGLSQYIVGVPTYFSFVPTEGIGINDGGLLYNKRVFGLGSNSSVLTGKALIMIALQMCFFPNLVKKYKLLLHLAVLVTLIITFSRSGMAAYIATLALLVIKNMVGKKAFYILLGLMVTALCLTTFIDWSLLVEQLTRGKGKVEVSGRDLIWLVYFDQILEAPYFGNFGIKNYLYVSAYGLMHAHNSIIMTLYIYGAIPLTLILLPLVSLIITKPSLIVALAPLAIYSMAQFYLLWGASLADVVMFAVLLNAIRFKVNEKSEQFTKGEQYVFSKINKV
jgi:hypothetical protein